MAEPTDITEQPEGSEPPLGSDATLSGEKGLNEGIGEDDTETEDVPHYSAQTQLPHLQNDDVFKTPIVPGEVPELNEDTKMIALTETALEDLKYLIEDIKRNHGMSQSFAIEAERISPGFINEKTPVGYYSASPSATRYKVSLEGLFAKVWEFVKAALQKIRDTFMKVVYWVLQIKNGSGKESDEELKAKAQREAELEERFAAALEKALLKMANATVEVANGVAHGVQVNASGQETRQFSDMDRLIGEVIGGAQQSEAIRNFMQTGDPIFADLVTHGPLSSTMSSTNKALSQSLLVLQEKTQLLSMTLIALVSGQSDTAKVTAPANIRRLSEPNEVKVNGEPMTLGDYANMLSELRATTEGIKHDKLFEFQDVFTLLANTMTRRNLGEIDAFVEVANLALIDVRAALNKAIDLLEKAPGQTHTAETNIDWHQAIHGLQEDMAGLTKVLLEVEQYRTKLKLMVAAVTAFGQEVAKAIEDKLADTGTNHQMPEYLKQLSEEAVKTRKLVAQFVSSRTVGEA